MNTIKALNKGKTFAIPEYAFQLFRGGNYLDKVEISGFGGGCKIIEGIEGFTFIEFVDRDIRDKIIGNFPEATAMNQKTDKNGRHIPELVGAFDDENSYYMIVYPNHADTDEINPNIGVFKGMVINPLALGNEIGEDKNVKDKVSKTLGDN
ncbi:hypothetical protein CSA08_04540 [Candidatus Gracilibacteria bacterium]|nr:MAG: hypothetical protein CSA08_04540 [Candidatus Gracilibacteria bacterium]